MYDRKTKNVAYDGTQLNTASIVPQNFSTKGDPLLTFMFNGHCPLLERHL